MKIIDIDTWSRKKYYEFFNGLDIPYFNLCFDLDVTNTLSYTKDNNLSFFKTIVFLTSKVANSISEIRYRIREDAIVEHELVHPSFTILREDNTFNFCTVDYYSDIELFFQKTDVVINKVKNLNYLAVEPNRDDLIYITCIPWVPFTNISHPVNLKPSDSIPRIAWGKYQSDRNIVKMPYSIQAHHALVDGVHIGQFYEQLQEYLFHPESFIDI